MPNSPLSYLQNYLPCVRAAKVEPQHWDSLSLCAPLRLSSSCPTMLDCSSISSMLNVDHLFSVNFELNYNHGFVWKITQSQKQPIEQKFVCFYCVKINTENWYSISKNHEWKLEKHTASVLHSRFGDLEITSSYRRLIMKSLKS